MSMPPFIKKAEEEKEQGIHLMMLIPLEARQGLPSRLCSTFKN